MDVALTEGPLDTANVVRRLGAEGDGGVGAVVAFTGIVRADDLGADLVDRIAFDCYPEMALEELERVRAETMARFGLAGLVIIHRTGTLRVGEEIVLVAAASRHRGPAFAAAAWAMDEVKARVPLWKREVSSSGEARWVEGRGSPG